MKVKKKQNRNFVDKQAKHANWQMLSLAILAVSRHFKAKFYTTVIKVFYSVNHKFRKQNHDRTISNVYCHRNPICLIKKYIAKGVQLIWSSSKKVSKKTYFSV